MRHLLKNISRFYLISLFLLFVVSALISYSTAPAHANGVGEGYGIGESVQTELGLPTKLEPTAVNIIGWALGFIGLVGVIIVIYGGFVWMTAAGNDERIASAKKTITAAIIGIIIVLLSLAIVIFVFEGVIIGGSGTGGEGGGEGGGWV